MKEVELVRIPKCDICGLDFAKYDAPTVFGPWAYQCEDCYKEQGSPKLGSILTEAL